ncbi:hypothetical protein ACFL6I_25220, partial [candidate division KSB1 bacterium]
VTLSTTTASTFSVEGNTTLGDSITDVTTINGSLVVTGATAVSTVDGNFGVGTTSPYARLSVHADANDTYNDTLLAVASSTASATTTHFVIKANGNVGIGTTSPLRRLSVTDAVSTAQFILSYDDTTYGDFLIDSVGDLTISPSGNDVFLNDDNFWICAGGACPSVASSGTGNLIVEKDAFIIGTTTVGNQFAIAPIAGTTTATGLYDNSGYLMVLFDEN